MLDMVGNPKDQLSPDAAHLYHTLNWPFFSPGEI